MTTYQHNGMLYWYCQGCKHAHSVHIDGKGGEQRNWAFTGTPDEPTLHPSLRVFMTVNGKDVTLCHNFVRQGKVEYLDDSTGHKLRGVHPMVHFPEGYGLPGLPSHPVTL